VIQLQWTTAFLGFLIAGVILLLIRRDHVHARYAFWWLPIAVAVAVLGAFPTLGDWLGTALGVHYPPILVVIAGLGLILIRLLVVDIESSRNERELRRVAQRLAILEGRFDDETKDPS